MDGVEEVTTNQDEKKTVHSLIVDPSKGNTEQIAHQLAVLLNKTPIGTISINDKQKTVFLEPLLDTVTPEDLKDIPVMTNEGMVPVSSVATLQSEERSTNQVHKDGDAYLRVTASVDPSKLSEIC